MPEGDTLRRAAARLQLLVGQRVEVETPHPRAAVKRLPERLGGRRLESVDAVGKNLLLRFEGGLVLRSHLRMSGRWHVAKRGAGRVGVPWLVLRGAEHEAVLWNGPVLELGHADTVAARLGPDILDRLPDLPGMVARLRSEDPGRAVGDALLDQRLVAGIGNVWRSEALWEVRVSPWRLLVHLTDPELLAVLETAHRLMSDSVAGTSRPRGVYRRAGRGCPRCGGAIRSHPQGKAARTAYWCPDCQPSAFDPA
jgi:endonuclease VIII